MYLINNLSFQLFKTLIMKVELFHSEEPVSSFQPDHILWETAQVFADFTVDFSSETSGVVSVSH